MDQRAIDDLARSGISPEEAENAEIFDVRDASQVYPDFEPLPALVIPYLNSDDTPMTFVRDGEDVPFCRVRYLQAPERNAAVRGKPQRYAQPKASGCQIYLPPILDWREIMADPGFSLLITEGEKKALCGCLAGLNVIGLGGVHNFLRAGFLHPLLREFTWRGRAVGIVFDSDAATNPHVALAEGRLLNILGMQLGANCGIHRLPQEGPQKVGLDDYIVAHGAAAAQMALRSPPSLSALERDVLTLNEHVAWVKREGILYEFRTGFHLKKQNFIEGDEYGKWTTWVGGEEGGKPKAVKTAKAWLTHPLARCFDDMLFRPGDGQTVPIPDGDGVALNMWRGWNAEKGDVQPFLELCAFLFQDLPEEWRDLPLKYLAWKAQNPQAKRALAIMLVGPAGCGKSMWSGIASEAFAPYNWPLQGETFGNTQFWGWLEKTVVSTIDELSMEQARKHRDILFNLVSQDRQAMNEKFRIERMILNYTMFIITTNYHEVASFTNDDRRMLVVDCPSHLRMGSAAAAEAFYNRVGAWADAGGARKLMWYLLNLDLKGWSPPMRAPMTQEKQVAMEEGLTPIQRIAVRMRTADENLVKVWLDQAYGWAQQHKSDAGYDGTVASGYMELLPHLAVRPFYTADELANILPPVCGMLGSENARMSQFTPGNISRALRNAGIKVLPAAETHEGFKWRGLMRQYLVIANVDDWSEPLTQREFERVMNGFPKFSDTIKKGLR